MKRSVQVCCHRGQLDSIVRRWSRPSDFLSSGQQLCVGPEALNTSYVHFHQPGQLLSCNKLVSFTLIELILLKFRSDNFSYIYNVMYKGITFCSESHDYFPLHSMPLYLLCKLFFYLSFYLLYFLFILAIHLSPYASFYLPQQFFSFVVSKLCVWNMQALLENHFVWN